MGWLEDALSSVGTLFAAKPKLSITGPTSWRAASGGIRICVRDPSGNPVHGAILLFVEAPTESGLKGIDKDVSGPDGCVSLDFVSFTGAYKVQATHRDYAPSDLHAFTLTSEEAPVFMRPDPGDVSALGVRLVTGSNNAPGAGNGYNGLARNVSF